MTPFLIDDQAKPAEGAHLDGFAWDGAHFIVGTEGLAAFEAENGPLPPAADGRHVLVRREGDRITIGADFAGYRHLFYWSDGPRWAVCDSFLDLVAHLRARDVPLTEDRAQTGAFLSRKQLFQQLTTDRTCVAEIACLDAGAHLEIGPEGLRAVPPAPLPQIPYPEALKAFLDLWLSRIATLRAAPDLTLHFHLSGGIDSRVVTAFHVYLAQRAGDPGNGSIRSLTDDRHAGDLKIAAEVAQAAGLSLNHLPQRPERALDADGALASWRITSAGVYSPLRIPTRDMHPADLHFSGHASSGYKIARSAGTAERDTAEMARNYGYFGRGDRVRWRAALDAHLMRLSNGTGDIGRGWTRWHRVNRARFHGGQAASYKTQIAILHSRAAATAATARPRDLPDYQFYHDILASLAPEIAKLPFDRDEKAQTDAVRARLTRVAPADPVPGAVWGAFAAPEAAKGSPHSSLALVRQIAAEADRGWHLLPRGRVRPIFRYHLWRIRRDLKRGRVRDAVRLRHLATVWLLIRLASLGVAMEEEIR